MFSLTLPASDRAVPLEADSAALLMVEAGTSSPHAFAAIVQHSRQSLLNFFSHHGACNDSEDLVQETFVRLYRYRSRYQPTARFSTFLFTIARHAWADHCRKAMRREKFTTRYQQETPAATPCWRTESDPDYDIEDALACLSPKLREVIDLHFYHGLRHQDIAASLRVPLGTVKSRVSLAIRKLRDSHVFQETGGCFAAE
ncbi:MAG: hypothetical protein JWO94_1571 [Verrucomicrobiaceae bacterium]|nr:hypothetical protein [Verrucomicrobiaceae bacterium]